MKRITVEQIQPLVGQLNGNIAAIARALGVSRGTIYNRMNESPALKEAMTDAHEAMLDNVESALYREVLNGNVTACIFWLKTQGRGRGWQERTEITGADGGPLVHANESDLDREITALVAEHERRTKAATEGETQDTPGADVDTSHTDDKAARVP